MADERLRGEFPHILLPTRPASEPFRPRGGGGGHPLRPIADPRRHAANLRSELETAVSRTQRTGAQLDPALRPPGLTLTVQGWVGNFELALESLDPLRTGIELLSVRPGSADRGETATVFIPFDKTQHFFRRLDEFATQQTPNGNPRHAPLVANIERLRQATLRELWTDAAPFPTDAGETWWEIWLRKTENVDETLQQVAVEFEWQLAARLVSFPNRVVTAIRATAESLGRSLSTALPLAEIRHPRLAESLAELPQQEQRRLVRDLAERLHPAPDDSPAICVLDTGVHPHSLLEDSLDPADRLSVVGDSGLDGEGHGTAMAGLALFGDLTDAIEAAGPIYLSHRLESVKIIPDRPAFHQPDTYGAVTAAAAAVPEVRRPERRRAFSLASSADNAHLDGRPTLWSATIDALAFGSDVGATATGISLLSEPHPDSARLFLVSAGNVRDGHQIDHLSLSDASPVEDPAQAWNCLSVGAYTELLDVPADPSWDGYRPVAARGEISPFSRTSVLFDKKWPLKPDLLMEGGNILVSASGRDFRWPETVSIVTTSRDEPFGRPLESVNATSAAVAHAAHLAGLATANYPSFWPETIRGLLVQAARWTEPMRAAIDAARTKPEKQRVIRRYGFGVPTETSVLRSASSAVTMIAQAAMRPFERPAGGSARLREMHLHEFPWPRAELLELGAADIELRVTLSYFVEPNASARGWRGRYVYPSHGLRFDTRRPGETTTQFRARLNDLAQAEETGAPGAGIEPNWLLGPIARHIGSLHSDVWYGTAADLADSGLIGIYPVGGWWKNNNRDDRMDFEVRYALLVSLSTPLIGVDLYTPIVAQIPIPIPIDV